MKDLAYFLANYSSITYYNKRNHLDYTLPFKILAESSLVIRKEKGRYFIEKNRFHRELQKLNLKELNYYLNYMEPLISKYNRKRERQIVA